MKVQLVTSLTVVAVAAVGSFHLYSAATLDAPKPILVQDAAWKMRYDSKLDGELSAKGDGEVRWKFAVRNNRISGSLADLKDGDPADHRLAGEIVEGEPPIVFLRQDGPKGLVCFYTGKRAEESRIVGTWFDNRGRSGDFELVIEKK